MPPHSRRVIRASFSGTFRSLNSEGAGKAGCRLHPWLPCNKKHGGRTTGETGKHSGFPCAMVLRLPSRSPWWPGSFATIASGFFRQLDASVGASGPHDFAVRLKRRSSRAHQRPPHPAPNVRDDREAPLLVRTGCAERCRWFGGDINEADCDQLARRANRALRRISDRKSQEPGHKPLDSASSMDTRFGAHPGLKSDLAWGPKSAMSWRNALLPHYSGFPPRLTGLPWARDVTYATRSVICSLPFAGGFPCSAPATQFWIFSSKVITLFFLTSNRG